MFNVSHRAKSSFKEKVQALKDLERKIDTCKKCPFHSSRKQALSGRFVEPTDILLLDTIPHESEDQAGSLLAGGREKSLEKLFSFAKPSLDISRVSYATVFKCFGKDAPSNECLPYLDEQIRILDPVVIVALGMSVLKTISNADLRLGVPYVTGDQGQHVLFGTFHPREVIADKDKNLPIWKAQIEVLTQFAQKYDLKGIR